MRLRLLPSACAAAALAQLFFAPTAPAQTRPCDSPPADCRSVTEDKTEAAVASPPAEASGEPAPPEASAAPAAVPLAPLTPFAAPAAAAPDAVLPALPVPVPTPHDTRAVRLADEDAYEDAYRVLSRENGCSRFFGGPALAVHVLNGFALKLRRQNLGDELAIRQSGDYTNYRDLLTGGSYRLFDEALLNTSGPFSRHTEMYGRHSERSIGRFPARSRQGRVLVLLHELGHLIRHGRTWLLPNDGHDAALSARNTRAVERHCAGELLALGE
ncbi:MAG TPA: hypothetical protein VK422_10675 [Pyrinomonadaceae bacterium]|nr:hypothetical protein [Pyrinomonadaceae bacterium]